MADLHSRLEGDLARELSPVAAPDCLWQRIHEQRRPLRVRARRWTTWSVATASLLALLAGVVWRLGAVNLHGDIAARPETADVRHTSFYSRRAVAFADKRLLQRPCLLCHAGV